MEEPNKSENELSKGGGFAKVAVWGAMILVLYFLSWGPAYRLVLIPATRARLSGLSAVWVFYRPLTWAEEHRVPVLAELMNAYTRLWWPAHSRLAPD